MKATKIYDSQNRPSQTEKTEIINFLFEHLEEYGDTKQNIKIAIEHSINELTCFGGFTILLTNKKTIIGAAVVNKIGMSDYIPENLLVYIAIHKSFRGKGLGKKLSQKAINYSNEDITLYIEANSPARLVYEKMGFSTPYLEMRLMK